MEPDNIEVYKIPPTGTKRKLIIDIVFIIIKKYKYFSDVLSNLFFDSIIQFL